MIFFQFFSHLAHLALQNLNKDYVIFSYFRKFVAKSDQKRKMGCYLQVALTFSIYTQAISIQPSELTYILAQKKRETGNVGPLYIDHACPIQDLTSHFFAATLALHQASELGYQLQKQAYCFHLSKRLIYI